MFRGDNSHISLFKKTTTFNSCFFLDTMKARSFKLYMIITLLEVYIVIVGLMTLTLFWILVLCSLVATYIKKITHNMICMSDVYSREIVNMFFIDQVSRLVENFYH